MFSLLSYFLINLASQNPITPLQIESKERCESIASENQGLFYRNGEFCKSVDTNSTIDPFDNQTIIRFQILRKMKNLCHSEAELTDFIIYADQSNCLCKANGQFTNYKSYYQQNENQLLKIYAQFHKNCKSAQENNQAPFSYDLGLGLEHYIKNLPTDSKPLVNVASLQSILQFMRSSNSSRTVKIVGEKIGTHGETVFIYRKKIGEDWFDFSDPVGQQLDPRWSARLLKPVIGAFFGFEKIDEDTYTMPSLAEYLNAVAAINREEKLLAGSAFTVEGQFGEVEYINKFITDGLLPASEFLNTGDQTYFFHDMGLHLASLIAFPPELYLRIQKTAKLIHETTFSIIKNKTYFSANTKQILFDKANLAAATLIDGFSVAPIALIMSDNSASAEQYFTMLDILFKQPQEFSDENLNFITKIYSLHDSARINNSELLTALKKQPKDADLVALQEKLEQTCPGQSYGKQIQYLLDEHKTKLEEKIKKLSLNN